MARERIPFDVPRLTKKVADCFICEFIEGNPRYPHHVVAETDTAVAFLNRFPTLFGYVLVTTKEHREQVTGDFTEDEYAELQRFIYRVSEGLRRLLSPERTYILSLGSQARNSHVHWHIAPLPEGVPLEQQQFHALMHEHGAIETTPDEMAQLAVDLRQAIGEG
ncbi:MAG: HIT family protein [Gemmatimonadetes bacterium]|jgi:diadenosine tetraphosphate (Ap4A) HIT family hydrolase|nr:HIT family protein [Gemmatimonadota bacterium]MBT7912832.1 HIT family protein [Candidatus Bathyarchaeota archaeon]